MKRLLKFRLLKNVLQQYPRQNYCICRCIYSNLFIPDRCSTQTALYNFSTLSAPNSSTGSVISELQEEFPEPKKILYQVLNEAFLKDQSLDIKPSLHTEQILVGPKQQNEYMWKIKLKMEWPQSFEVESVAKRKTDALNICFLYACQKLKQLGILDQSNSPALPKRKISDQSINTAKGDLLNVFQRIWHRSGNRDLMPKFNSLHVQGLFGNYWETELQIAYPENKVFKAAAFRSSTSEGIAALEALSWLQKEGIISKTHRLLNYSKDDENRLKEFHQSPYSICLLPSLQEKMQNVISEIKKLRSQLSYREEVASMGPLEENELINENVITDLITDKLYHPLTNEELRIRNEVLYKKNKNKDEKLSTSLADIREAKSLLPVAQKREDILKLIDENQVIVLSGDTGCGKSTQIPQFILDHYINNMKGAECNIIVSQPRRISALSLAERVAAERGETVGDVVGYHIRLDKRLPEGNGAILYCTTGMLLKKFLSNPSLEGLTHVIIDEIHERHIQIDFLLILLKNILETNKKVKVLLMSASFNSNVFAQYFNCSQVIHIPGKMHPVDEYFLENLIDVIPNCKNMDHMEPIFDVDLITNAIDYINKNQPPGAILCFLPGWHEIRSVYSKLLEKCDKLFICPTHSRIPPEDQKKIFLKPPEGQRKVILATNIAETSLTIDDVVYVVDSGLHKNTHLDTDMGIPSLATQWITKANVRQRKGRAGRVKPGKCYHLFSWKTFMKMGEYPVPEILRVPLESVILDCKLFCKGVKAKEYLSKALQPPDANAIENGINNLQVLNVLDENEDLTVLGKAVAHSSAHPRLSVALVYSAFLGCLDPMLTICASLTSEKEPFLNTLDDMIQIKKVKAMHDNYLYSDHLALTKIFDTWNTLSENDVGEYLEKNLLDPDSLLRIKLLKELFSEDVCVSEFVENEKSFNETSNENFLHNPHVPSVLAALTVAFFPNVLKVLQGEISQGKLNRNSLVYSLIKGQKAYIQKESVASEEENLPSPWLIYFSALKSEARRKAMISSVSSIPGICLLLFAGKDISMTSVQKNNKQGNLAALNIDDYKLLQFVCTEKEARLLLDFRECLHEIFNLYIKKLKHNCEEREYMISCRSKFLPVLKDVLETPQVPFTKGQVYEFVNNELISKEFQI